MNMEKCKFYVLPKLPYDYKNARAKIVDAFWNIANWNTVNERLEELLK